MTLAKGSGPRRVSAGVPDRSAARLDVEQYLLDHFGSSAPATRGEARRRAMQLLLLLGSPQESLRVVHVAGTAGKGSVSNYISSILRAHGFGTGAFLSPHVHSVLERFQVDGKDAPVRDLAAAVEGVRYVERLVNDGDLGRVTMFEAATAAAFKLFSDLHVDYAVVEAGIGGIHDATNTVARRDKLAVLTSIGVDHADVLGSTLSDIASQKAGVLPVRGGAIAVRSHPVVDDVVAVEAARLGCQLEQPSATDLTEELTPYVGSHGFAGPHDRANAGLAMRAVRFLAKRDDWQLEPECVEAGLRKARMPGRFELRRWKGRPIVLDGAHNPMKLAALAAAVRERWPGQAAVWVLSLRVGKELGASTEVISRTASVVVATEFNSEWRPHGSVGALPAARIAEAAARNGLDSATAQDLPEALDLARSRSEPDVPIIVAGSFQLVADAVKVLGP